MVSIIIVNYKSEQYLQKCISSIRERVLGADYEIIVVNNDVNCELLLPGSVTLINSKKNTGFGSACNLGAKNAKGEILWFLNPDTEIVSENINKIISRLEGDLHTAVVGPRLLTEKGKTQPWCAGREASLWNIFKNNLGLIESKRIWESRKEVSADWVSGAALFVKKEVFEKAKGFDEDFFMYFEDDDLCRRIRALGYGVLYCPEVTVLHVGGKSREGFLKQKKQFFKSMCTYFKKKRLKKDPIFAL